MRAVLLTLYDQSAHGARCLAAAAQSAGHEVLLITFKRYVVKRVSRDDPRERDEIAARGHLPLYDVTPFGDVACPYPSPVTETEKEILLGRLERFHPDVLGFSVTSAHLPLVRELSTDIRRRFPRLPQVWGGIHPTMAPEECLKYADAVCVGEGDDAFLEYLDNPRRTDIQTFHFKDADGRHVANPLRPLIQDLDRLPMPMYGEEGKEILIDEDRELGPTDFSNREGPHAHLVVSSQRGCPFSCSYCLHCVVRGLYPHQKYLRRKSVDKFLDEVQCRVRRFRPEWIYFWDEIFMVGREWIEEFCDKYPRRVGIPFGGYGYPQTTTRPMLEMLKQAGCTLVGLGVQSGSERIAAEIYDRHASNEEYVRFGDDLRETGFEEHVVYDLLTSCPFEREEDLRATVALLSRMPKPAHVTLKRLVFFPFTPIAQRERPKSEIGPRTYLFYDMLCILAGMPGVPPVILPALADDAYLRDHPEILEKWAQQIETADAEKKAAESRLKELDAAMPWGIKRATRHFARQVANRLARAARG